MKRLICLFLIAALVLGMSACGPEVPSYIPGDGLHQDGTTVPTLPQGDAEQQLQLVYYPEKTLNPYNVSDFTNRVLMPLLYQGLFSIDRNYNVIPILCKRYTVSQDMLVYSFYLEEASFSDGSLLTAEDAAASLRYAQSSPVYSGRLKAVTDIAVTEDGALQLSLSIPYENLPLLLDIPIVKAGEADLDFPMGTGAYYRNAGIDGKIGLQRRSDWWCRSNLPATASFIPLVEAKSNYQIRNEFEYGNIDLVCADPGSDNFAEFRNDHELWQSENGMFLYLACNESSKVFSNTAIRQALTHAIDRDALVENYYRGFALAATLPASPNSPVYNKALAAKYGYAPEALKTAIVEAELSTTSITLLVNKADSRRVRAANAIAWMLAECGLTVSISSLSGTSYTNALKKGSFDLHLGQTILSPNMDLTAFFENGGSLSYGGLTDAALHVLCQEAMANSGNYFTLYQKIMADAMLCPILFRSYAIYTTRGAVPTLDPARDNLFCYSIGKQLEDVWDWETA